MKAFADRGRWIGATIVGRFLEVQADCYAGYRGEQTPRRVRLGARTVEVARILDCWLAPDHRYFKFEGDDGAAYILRHDVAEQRWELTLYEARRSGER